jgi:hypothetical protein
VLFYLYGMELCQVVQAAEADIVAVVGISFARVS